MCMQLLQLHPPPFRDLLFPYIMCIASIFWAGIWGYRLELFPTSTGTSSLFRNLTRKESYALLHSACWPAIAPGAACRVHRPSSCMYCDCKQQQQLCCGRQQQLRLCVSLSQNKGPAGCAVLSRQEEQGDDDAKEGAPALKCCCSLLVSQLGVLPGN